MPVGLRVPFDDDMRAFLGMGLAEEDAPVEAEAAPRYTIPPVVWMFVFLIAGWLIVRMLLED